MRFEFELKIPFPSFILYFYICGASFTTTTTTTNKQMCNKTETHLHNILYNDERDGKGQSEGGRKYNRNVWFNSSHTQRFKKKCKKITATTTAKPYLRIRRKGSCSTFQKPVV